MKKNKRNKACVCLHYWRCQKGNCSCSNEEPTPIEIPLESIGAPSTNSVSLTVWEQTQVSFNFLPTNANTLNRDVQVVSTDDNIVSPGLASWWEDWVAYIDIIATWAGNATVTYSFAGTSYNIVVTVEPNYNYVFESYTGSSDELIYHAAQTVPTRSTKRGKKNVNVVSEYYFFTDDEASPSFAAINDSEGSWARNVIYNMDYALQIRTRSNAAITEWTQEAYKLMFNEYKQLYINEGETDYYYDIYVSDLGEYYNYIIISKYKEGWATIWWYEFKINAWEQISNASITQYAGSEWVSITDLEDAEALKTEFVNALADYRNWDQAYAYAWVVLEKYTQDNRNVKSIKEDTITLDELTK